MVVTSPVGEERDLARDLDRLTETGSPDRERVVGIVLHPSGRWRATLVERVRRPAGMVTRDVAWAEGRTALAAGRALVRLVDDRAGRRPAWLVPRSGRRGSDG